MKSLRDLRARIEIGHARRSEIEVELTRRQSELQFLDETSRKELSVAVAELETPEDTSPEVLAGLRSLVPGNAERRSRTWAP